MRCTISVITISVCITLLFSGCQNKNPYPHDNHFFVHKLKPANPNIAISMESGGEGWEDAAQLCDDDGIVIGANTRRSFGKTMDMLIMKYDYAGQLLWAYTYGGSHKDMVKGVIPVRNSGVLVMGESYSPFTGFFNQLISPKTLAPRSLFLRFDKHQQLKWAMDFLDFGTTLVEGVRLQNANFVFAGQNQDTGNLILAQLASNGKVLKEMPVTRGYAHRIMALSDQKLVVLGNRLTDTESEMLLLKFTDPFHPEWGVSYVVPSGDMRAAAVCELPDHGFVIAGSLNWKGTQYAGLMRTDSAGKPLWLKAYGGTRSLSITNMVLLSDNTLVLTGSSWYTNNGKSDACHLVVDLSGNLLRYQSYGTMGTDRFTALVRSDLHGLYSVGEIDLNADDKANVWLFKLIDVNGITSFIPSKKFNVCDIPVTAASIQMQLSINTFMAPMDRKAVLNRKILQGTAWDKKK